MKRVYERDTDEVFIRRFRHDQFFAAAFLKLVQCGGERIQRVSGQTRHRGVSGTIDLDIQCASGRRLIVENKIDAGYSVTRLGDGQAERYCRTVRAFRDAGEAIASVLVAPRKYLNGSRMASSFEHNVEYEQLVSLLDGEDKALVDAAIVQAQMPYEPIANVNAGEFFKSYRAFVQERFPDLSMKKDPNAGGIRPDDSRTVYFNVKRTLNIHLDVPLPRMSLQCWDKAAASASVKIMLGGWGPFQQVIGHHPSLNDHGAYIRSAGQSLGIVIDTPRLDTQRRLDEQIESVVEGLEGALRLQSWWNASADVLREWGHVVRRSVPSR